MLPIPLRRSVDWRPQSTSRDMEPLLLTPSLHATLLTPRRSLKSPNVTARERSTRSRSPSKNQTHERRARLGDVVAGSGVGVPDAPARSGRAGAWKHVVERGYEDTSPRPGARCTRAGRRDG